MNVKPALSIEEQIDKLKERGCIIENDDNPGETLSKINYYRFTAYLLPFKNSDDTYKPGTTFKKVLKIYEFDQKLRNLISYAIDFIEIEMRTRVSYEHSTNYGPLGYLEASNLSLGINHSEFIDTVEKYKDREKNNIIIKHHKSKYDGNIPFWAMIEFFSFTELSKFYQNMIISDKKRIAKNYHQYYSLIESWLYCLSFLRNSCAHYSRLYYSRMIPIPKTPKGYPYLLDQSIFSYLTMIKLLLVTSEAWTQQISPNLKMLINSYKPYIETEHLGFPKNWEQYLK
ncbi:MAG: Abi family protein [Bacillota bacterium]